MELLQFWDSVLESMLLIIGGGVLISLVLLLLPDGTLQLSPTEKTLTLSLVFVMLITLGVALCFFLT